MTSSLSRTSKPPRALAPRAHVTSDHNGYHRTVGRAMLGAGGGALVADLVSRLTGTALVDSPLLLLGIMGGALGAVAAKQKPWWKKILGMTAGAVGAALFTVASPLWPPFAALLLGLAAAPILADKQPIRRQALTAVLAGAASAAGLHVARALVGWEILDGVVPSVLGHAAAGAAAGLFVGLSSGPKHLLLPMDPVKSRFLDALTVKDGELYDILRRAFDLHKTIQGDLAQREQLPLPQLDERVGALMLRILDVADQCRQIETDLAATPEQDLRNRVDALTKKAEAASDPSAEQTYRKTIAQLQEQLEALKSIGQGRERIIARLHAHVAILEKLRFSLIHLRSADIERTGVETSPVTEALEELTRELETTSSAMSEVYGQGVETEPAALPPIAS